MWRGLLSRGNFSHIAINKNSNLVLGRMSSWWIWWDKIRWIILSYNARHFWIFIIYHCTKYAPKQYLSVDNRLFIQWNYLIWLVSTQNKTEIFPKMPEAVRLKAIAMFLRFMVKKLGKTKNFSTTFLVTNLRSHD